jgi:hypothetical protein
MTRAQFEQLPKQQQIQTIRQYGEFVAERTEAGNRLYLYIINSFYIELIHELSNINNKGLAIIRVFDDVTHLNAYTEKAAPTQLQA